MNTEQEVSGQATTSEASQVDLVVGDLSWGRRFALAAVLLLITLLVLLGVFRVARGSPVQSVVVEDFRDLPSPRDHGLFARTMELLSNATLTRGNSVELLLNGDGTFPRMWSDIDAAGESVTVQMYYSTPGRLVDSLGAHLSAKARTGVRVLLLLDAFGSRKLERTWLNQLRAAGVQVGHLRPLAWYKLDRVSHRSHLRSVVVDGRIGYAGGFGFGDIWLGDGQSQDQWRETNIRVTGPVVLQLQATFMAGWAEATGELLPGEVYFPATTLAEDTVRAGLFNFFPNTGSSAAERFLAVSIAAARRTLYVSNSYFVPDVQFRRMLGEAARRGVDVRVLTAGPSTDVPSTRFAARSTYGELLEAGVRIYEYQPTMMHAKTFVVDGEWSTVGSLNFDNRSMAYNDEANVAILDATFGAAMDSLFARDLERSLEITLDDFRRRPFWERIFEVSMSLIAAIL